MKCASCGDKIKGEPIWIDDDPFCSEECADIGPMDDDDEFEEEEEEEEEEK